MTFGAPGYLLLIPLALAAAASVAGWAAWRAGAERRFGAAPAEGRLAPLVRAVVLVAALSLVVVAAARPQFGSRPVEFEDRGIDLVIAVDVSQSMLADDVQPTRLARAEDEIEALLEQLRGDRVGLVIFAAEPFPRSPLTSDLGAARSLVSGLSQERSLVAPGSDLGAAITAGERLLGGGEAQTKVLLLVSDGEHHGAQVSAAVESARAAGIVIYTAGVGTPAGAQVRDVDPDTGELVPRFDAAGDPVMTRVDAAQLRSLAAAGGGRYLELAGDDRPLVALAPEFAGLARTLFGVEQEPRPIERFQLVAAAALVLIVGELLLPALWRRRPRLAFARRLWPVAGAALFLGAVCTSSVAELNREGNREFEGGDYGAALERYRDASAIEPERAEPYYNAGNALHRTGEYDRAVDEAKRALPADSPELEALVEYAIGNHHFLAGRLRDAIEAYKRALLADPRDADAKHNLELALAHLRATPSPEPTPTPPPPEAPPNGDGEDGGGGAEGTSTPGAAGGTPGPPDPEGGPPRDPDELSPEELRAALFDALLGIDSEFTVEEALRVLDLLSEQNRQWLEQREPPPGSGGAPDY